MVDRIIKFFKDGHQRSVQAKKNVFFSLLIKGFNVIIGILILPLTLKYLGTTKYGIWLTVGSVIDWFAFFDIGLSNGLRNRLAEAISKKNFIRARMYISTSYAFLVIISFGLLSLFFIGQHFISWTTIFNTSVEYEDEIRSLIQIVFTFFCLKFILQLLNSILLAHQQPAVRDFIQLFSKIISSLAIVILFYATTGSLVYVAYAYSIVPAFILIGASVYFFNSRYSKYKPSIKFIRFRSLNGIMNLGMKFFVIHIAVVIMFSTDNMILTQLYGPESVTPYNIAYRYFGIYTMIFSIIMSPIWSAATEAYSTGDYQWIRNVVRKFHILWLASIVIIVLMLVFSQKLFRLWVGNEVHIPVLLTIFMCFHVIFSTYGSIYVNVLNGMGKVKIQYYVAIISALINIPLSVFFAKVLNLGPSGVILATSVCISFGPLIAPVQYRKVINGSAKGIWNA